VVKVQVYILSRDRLHYFNEALISVLNQSTRHKYEIIVSDNSETDVIETLMRSEFKDIKYIRRTPTLISTNHFKKIMDESSGPLVVLFHDDDVMLPNYIETMVDLMDLNPNISALGCNAYVLKGTDVSKRLMMGSFKGFKVLKSNVELINPYLEIGSISPAPFPGYMYRREFLDASNVRPEHGGKYSDITFLVKTFRAAPIAWLSEPLFKYRIHASNDSKAESLLDRLSLMRYLYSHEGVAKNSNAACEMRFKFWGLWWWSQSLGFSWLHGFQSKQNRIVFKFLLLNGIRIAFTRLSLWKKLLNKL
jgi:cellulose synthase/poly-beta-1,6-N-acetylglucosamine synthase-like glycosyltransferase